MTLSIMRRRMNAALFLIMAGLPWIYARIGSKLREEPSSRPGKVPSGMALIPFPIRHEHDMESVLRIRPFLISAA